MFVLNYVQVAKLNSSGMEEMIQLNSSTNHLSYNLKSNQDFDLTVWIDDEKCTNQFREKASATYKFNASSKHASFFSF